MSHLACGGRHLLFVATDAGSCTSALQGVKRSRQGAGHSETVEGQGTLEVCNVSDSRILRQVQVWKALATSAQLLQQGSRATQRELYYLHAGSGIFRSQADSNAALAAAASILKAPRISLGFLTSTRGLVTGSVLVCLQPAATPGRGVWSSLQGQVMGVPADYLAPSFSCSSVGLPPTERPRFILVVEKECIFQRLLDDGFTSQIPCVLVTAKGMPDVATRAFVHRLHTDMRLPVLGMSDWNPWGLAIMLAYKHGTSGVGAEGTAFPVPLQWIGLHGHDASECCLPDSSWQTLTPRDVTRCRNMLSDPHVRACPAYVRELQSMLASDGKMEAEALLCNGIEFMSHQYLPKKVQWRDGE